MGAPRRGPSAFSKTIGRDIRGSLGRFLAILGIVALGCGFFAGLQMCGPDMRAAAHELYNGTNLYDIRLVSTLGFTKTDVERVREVKGVESAMPAMSCDAMARLGDDQAAVRVSSLDVDAAGAGKEQGATAILSRDGSYLNRVFLRSGRWPRGAKECVVAADKVVVGTEVGDVIRLLYGSVDLDDMLCERDFQVVGTVSSSAYPYTGSFGSTTLGSGMIEEYVYVTPDAFADGAPYTEIYARVEGSGDYESGSDDYQAVVDEVRERLEGQKDELARLRLADVRAKAQRDLDEATDDYERERDDALRKLDDAKKELEDGRRELADGEAKLADGQRAYDDGVIQVERAWRDLEDALRTLESSRAQLEKARADLADGEGEWDKGVTQLVAQLGLPEGSTLAQARAFTQAKHDELTEGRAQLESGIEQTRAAEQEATRGIAQATEGLAQLDAGIAQATEGLPQLDAGIGEAQQGIAALDAQIAQMPEGEQRSAMEAQREQAAQQLAGLQAQREQTAQQLPVLQAQREDVSAQLKKAQEGLVQAQDTRKQLEAQLAGLPPTTDLDEALAGISKLEESRRTLDAAAAQLDAGQRELNAGIAAYEDGRSKAAQGQRELNDSAQKLVEAQDELERGRKEYEDGLAEYEDAKKTAEEELADGKRQLDDAQKKIDEIEKPDIYLLDRSQNEGVLTYDADSHRMDHIADVFPFMFFLVAALVALTTMTRMVDDDRIVIGTFKALGYSKTRIASRYLAYAGAASLVGAALGIAILSQLLPFIVTTAYSIIYTVPRQPFPLPVSPAVALASGGMGVGVTLVATYAAVIASLRETPATLMLPRAPAAGKRILLERLTPVWRALSFSWKVTCRNLFRYKRRLAMTVIGISGCTALLLVGFGLHDAIWDIIDCQYGPIIHFDTTVGLDDDAMEADVRQVVAYLSDTGKVTDIVRVQQSNMRAGTRSKDETMHVQVIVPRDLDELEDAITFRERVSRKPIELDDDSVVVTEKIALKYGISVGDDVVLFDQDTIGNAKGRGHALRVTGVAENYVGNHVYVGRGAWKDVDDSAPVFSTIYANTVANEDVRQEISSDLLARDDVSTVVFSDETMNLYRNMLSVVDMVVVLLIVSAGLLAFIVLYNLTNINIGERVREIASLKVLGFTKGEVYAYIFREIVLSAVLGDVLGMVLGTYLETFVATTAEVDYVMFGRTIHPVSYVYSFALTLAFTGLILALMRHKLDRVNMVESLKSVE